jgi:cytoplasmic iron level regulating protein YaaA (DUF328/UPF0246 family)
MIVILSPAKSMGSETFLNNLPRSIGLFKDSSIKIISVCKDIEKDEMIKLMKISSNIADLNISRFVNFKVAESESLSDEEIIYNNFKQCGAVFDVKLNKLKYPNII